MDDCLRPFEKRFATYKHAEESNHAPLPKTPKTPKLTLFYQILDLEILVNLLIIVGRPIRNA
jgi:hypothetical protein